MAAPKTADILEPKHVCGTPMRVLVVEDNQDLNRHLTQGLREQGFAVDSVTDGLAGRQHAACDVYDVLIVDRMLPGLDGLEIVRELRACGVATPAIFLTALSAVRDRIEGLDAGGDDYLVKPFAFAELLARIRVLMRRRSNDPTSNVVQVADLKLDPVNRTVERRGRPIELSAKQFSLLHYLMRHAGHVVSRTMILERVWNFQFEGLTNVVDVHINRLRNKIDRPFDIPLIHTLRGVGYVLREP
ncbi:MAG TPA: response regulator transcription factor [Pirellulales bacterium]|jgi:two-component system OmpR family response regulator|nr:response regulator transcription factor [Pirellulales bacterium]